MVERVLEKCGYRSHQYRANQAIASEENIVTDFSLESHSPDVANRRLEDRCSIEEMARKKPAEHPAGPVCLLHPHATRGIIPKHREQDVRVTHAEKRE
jgi:hypothetical protein